MAIFIVISIIFQDGQASLKPQCVNQLTVDFSWMGTRFDWFNRPTTWRMTLITIRCSEVAPQCTVPTPAAQETGFVLRRPLLRSFQLGDHHGDGDDHHHDNVDDHVDGDDHDEGNGDLEQGLNNKHLLSQRVPTTNGQGALQTAHAKLLLRLRFRYFILQ